jgi:hypothetical protein
MTNALAFLNYILSTINKINISDKNRRLNIYAPYRISSFSMKKPYKELVRNDVLQYQDSFRKPEASDPLHNWIGT